MTQGSGQGAQEGRSRFFRGVSHLALDAKGRVAIPAKYRDALSGDPADAAPLVLTADPGGCLLLYPRAAWEPIEARLMALSSFSDQIRSLQRLLVGHADEVGIDGAGRVLVPPSLRQYAGLEHDVVLVGQGNKFELWDLARWADATRRAASFPSGDLPPELSGFTL